MKKYWKNQPLFDRRLVTSASSPVKNRAILFKKNDDRFPPFAVTIPLKRKSRLLGPLTFCILSISVRESSWKKNTPFTFFDLSKRPSPSVHVFNLLILHILQLISLICFNFPRKFHLMWKTRKYTFALSNVNFNVN